MNFLRFMGFLLLGLLLITVKSPLPERKWNFSKTAAVEFERTALPDRDFVYYTVKSGDTLSVIMMKFRVVSQDVILEMNPSLDVNRLKAGTQIKIPL